MPRPSGSSTKREYERRNPGASTDPPRRNPKRLKPRIRNDVALPGSQNADLRGSRRDRSKRGATT